MTKLENSRLVFGDVTLKKLYNLQHVRSLDYRACDKSYFVGDMYMRIDSPATFNIFDEGSVKEFHRIVYETTDEILGIICEIGNVSLLKKQYNEWDKSISLTMSMKFDGILMGNDSAKALIDNGGCAFLQKGHFFDACKNQLYFDGTKGMVVLPGEKLSHGVNGDIYIVRKNGSRYKPKKA